MKWPPTWEDVLHKARASEKDGSEFERVYITMLIDKPFNRKTAWDDLEHNTKHVCTNRNPMRIVAWSKDFVYFLAIDTTGDAYIDSVPRNPP